MTAAEARGRAGALWGTTTPRLALFLGLGALIVVVDQVSKRWVDESFPLSRASSVAAGPLAAPTQVLGDWVRISKGYNDGAIFSLFGSTATFMAVASLVAIAVILWWEITRGSRGPLLMTLALGLLLGGAIGNLIDRVRLGYVVDFVDMGIGTWRFYTFNVADSAISVSLAVLFLVALLGERLGRSQPESREPGPGGR